MSARPVPVTTGGPDGRATTDDALLRIDRLAIWFDTAQGMVRAVDGVDLRLRRGATLGLVGESGSGKSVLSRAIMNILPSTAHVLPGSHIEFAGINLLGTSRHQRRHLWGVDVAMVFQDPMTSLTPVLTVGQQIVEVLRYHLRLGRAQARETARELLEQVGIPDAARRLDQYPHNLSGGMRQRVTIALAVACRPSLLIADEPTTALDVTIQDQILTLLATLQAERGMSLVLVTHDLGVAAGRTDTIAVMYAGRIVETGPTRALFARPQHPYTQALIDAIPSVRAPGRQRLPTIPGRPPVVIDPTPGCGFAPRCPRAQARCRAETPGLEAVPTDPDHLRACFFPLDGGSGDRARFETRVGPYPGATSSGLGGGTDGD